MATSKSEITQHPSNIEVFDEEVKSMFIYGQIKGRRKSIFVIYDTGAIPVLVREKLLGNELVAYKYEEDAVTINGIGGEIESARWIVSLPLNSKGVELIAADVYGVSNILEPIKEVDLAEFIENQKRHLDDKTLNKLSRYHIYNFFGGTIDALIGLKLFKYHPEFVMEISSTGLSLFKSKLKPFNSDCEITIGGPYHAILQESKRHEHSTLMTQHWDEIGKDMKGRSPNEFICPSSIVAAAVNGSSRAVKMEKCQSNAFNSLPFHNLINDHSTKKSSTNDETCLVSYIMECVRVSHEMDAEYRKMSYNHASSEQHPNQDLFVLSVKDGTLSDDIKDLMGIPGGRMFVSPEGDGNMVENACDELFEVHRNNVLDKEMYKEFCKDMSVIYPPTHADYRCVDCRNCGTCRRMSRYEGSKISRREHEDEYYIDKSIYPDDINNRFVGKLPFTKDPIQHLANNELQARVRLRKTLKGLEGKTEDIEMLKTSFNRLVELGYYQKFDDLSPEMKESINKAPLQLYIAWQAVLKSTSISTPCRIVLDASQKTSTKLSINDCLAKGIIDLDFMRLALNLMANRHILALDVSKYYNSLFLHEDHWCYQQLLWAPNFDPNEEPERYVLKCAVYGVKSSSRQLERCLEIIAEKHTSNKDLHFLLTKGKYVDDMACSLHSRERRDEMVQEVKDALAQYGMKIKGFVKNGEDPDECMSENGQLCIGGYVYTPKQDHFQIRVPVLQFKYEKRKGRLLPEDCYSGTTFEELDEFVPKSLKLRTVVSKVAEVFDRLGYIDPWKLKCKILIRRSMESVGHTEDGKIDWQGVLPPQIRKEWIAVFHERQQLEGITYPRFPISPSICTKQCVLLCFADGSLIAQQQIVYIGYKNEMGGFECAFLCGKNQLVKKETTIPNIELNSIVEAARLVDYCRGALPHVGGVYIFTDSSIAGFWIRKASAALATFHKNRVNVILRHVNVEDIFHCRTKHNSADVGTRPHNVDATFPDSFYRKGPDFLQNLKEAEEEGIITKLRNLSLSKEKLREAMAGLPGKVIMPDDYLHSVLAVPDNEPVRAISVAKTTQRYNCHKLGYLIDPLYHGWRRAVEIMGFVYKAVYKWKKRTFDGRDCKKLDNLLLGFNKVDFITSSMPRGGKHTRKISLESVYASHEEMQYFRMMGVCYFLRLAGEESRKYIDGKSLANHGYFEDGMCFARSRITDLCELQSTIKDITLPELRVQGRLPFLERHSPVSIAIVKHFHECVTPRHQGITGTMAKLSQACIIFKGKFLITSIIKECILCRIKLKKMRQTSLGPVHSRMTFTHVLYFCHLDMSGPYSVRICPQKMNLRGKNSHMKIWLLHSICVVSHYSMAEIMEDESTDEFLNAFSKMGSLVGYPARVLIDSGSAEVKGLTQAGFNVGDAISGLYYHFGVEATLCGTGGKSHSRHGHVERKIQSFKSYTKEYRKILERLNRSQFDTVSKLVCSRLNTLPLGLRERRNSNPVAQFITPMSFLTGVRDGSRLPAGFPQIARRKDALDSIQQLSEGLLRFFSAHVGSFLLREKYGIDDDELSIGDLILFEHKESDFSESIWKLGRVADLQHDSDFVNRIVSIKYCNAKEVIYPDDDRKDLEIKVMVREKIKATHTVCKIYSITSDHIDNDLKEIMKAYCDTKRSVV